MTTDLQTELRKSTGWLIALSILLILLGIAAIFMPGVASVTFTLVLAWILLISGIIRTKSAWQTTGGYGYRHPGRNSKYFLPIVHCLLSIAYRHR
ncbi:MAG: DUF308 domain-containing protein [Leptolyngbyaceae cyanobacterium HOT.MB2.61]|jgi:uncharacterized membrane protein HdeD (DUF308 family)|nr:DUF308 domain-containing protein [Leptolyngbyaceae cyanobacterium HOT.MB2.61]